MESVQVLVLCITIIAFLLWVMELKRQIVAIDLRNKALEHESAKLKELLRDKKSGGDDWSQPSGSSSRVSISK